MGSQEAAELHLSVWAPFLQTVAPSGGHKEQLHLTGTVPGARAAVLGVRGARSPTQPGGDVGGKPSSPSACSPWQPSRQAGSEPLRRGHCLICSRAPKQVLSSPLALTVWQGGLGQAAACPGAQCRHNASNEGRWEGPGARNQGANMTSSSPRPPPWAEPPRGTPLYYLACPGPAPLCAAPSLTI